MRVAIVTPYPADDGQIGGGVEAAAEMLVKGFQCLGSGCPDIFIIAPGQDRTATLENRNGVTIHWLPRLRLPGSMGYWTEQRIEIQRMLRRINPDITHFQGLYGWALGWPGPHIVTVHGIPEKDVQYSSNGALLAGLKATLIGAVERYGRRRAHSTILISPYVKVELGAHLGGDLYEIENPVADDYFHVKRQPGNLPVALYVGRVSARKNILGMIDAFQSVVDYQPAATLRIAGAVDDQEYYAGCIERIAANGLTNNVAFLGPVGRDRLVSELSEAKVLLLLSFQETAPIVIQEAMAAGVPVVASDVGGVRWSVSNLESGFLVIPTDTFGAAHSISKLIGDDQLAKEMGNAGRRIAFARFHYQSVARRTLDAYVQVISSPPVI